MERKMYVKEAIKRYSSETGKSTAFIKRDLSELLYPKSTIESRAVLMSLLYNDKIKNVPIGSIGLICEKLHISPNELFLGCEPSK
jgi:DNA-binding Xre family transcriptional regulator